jgi:hypothetical protein
MKRVNKENVIIFETSTCHTTSLWHCVATRTSTPSTPTGPDADTGTDTDTDTNTGTRTNITIPITVTMTTFSITVVGTQHCFEPQEPILTMKKQGKTQTKKGFVAIGML